MIYLCICSIMSFSASQTPRLHSSGIELYAANVSGEPTSTCFLPSVVPASFNEMEWD